MKNEIEVRYEKAVEQAREAIEELRLAALAKGYEDAKRDLQAVKPVGKFTPITAQEHRDEIVEMAKRDVTELAKNGFARNEYGDKRVVKFIVNKDKRTVVVLLRGYLSGNVYEKGIAKCAPTDCFNVHIGKAIALRRALGLEVPEEYASAPQPTEVRVGDVVASTINTKPKWVVADTELDGKLTVKNLQNSAIIHRGVDASILYTIDDSREGGAE